MFTAPRTWTELVELEPALRDLEPAATLAETRLADDFCASVYWTRVVKPALVGMLGWRRTGSSRYTAEEAEFLDSSRAFDIASKYLLDRLPACRKCGCIRTAA